VGIPEPARRAHAYPHEISGGMAQRVMIAAALVCMPELIIADEPTTALDVTIQAQILELLGEVRQRSHASMILITHNMGVIAEMADRVAVMYAGRVVEEADAKELFARPLHPYTQGLLASIPTVGEAKDRLPVIRGSVPSLIDLPPGCKFASRCRAREEHNLSVCTQVEPELAVVAGNHKVRCWLYHDSAEHSAPLSGAASPSDEPAGLPAATPPPPVQERPFPIPQKVNHGAGTEPPVLVSVENLVKHYPARRGSLSRSRDSIRAVDDVSFAVRAGETLGLVGESGCGKTTVARAILRLVPATSGSVVIDGEDVFAAGKSALKALRRDMQLIFQDPLASLDPRMTVGEGIGVGLRAHGMKSAKERHERAADLLKEVGLEPYHAQRYPHELSGGQRQRVGIARALALRPKFLVCDEPVSALDVSVQAQVLNLLRDLQRDANLTYLFIAHDLSVVEHMSDRVAVMYLGKIVEMADQDELYRRPLHPYTQALMSAIPVPDPVSKRERIILEGEMPSPRRPPSGCRFRTRCPHATQICGEAEPALRQFGAAGGRPDGEGHRVACHHAEKFT
jgi:peptide/nickel transport system ATP-binding protein